MSNPVNLSFAVACKEVFSHPLIYIPKSLMARLRYFVTVDMNSGRNCLLKVTEGEGELHPYV